MKATVNVRQFCAGALILVLIAMVVVITIAPRDMAAADFKRRISPYGACDGPVCESPSGPLVSDMELSGLPGGTWYWLRSPDEEKRVIMGLYNRYCIRCHGVDGRGVWDIPDVPDFTNPRWHAHRSDGQLTRSILEGRGACMPPFRGTMTLEEACAMARYLRTFIPGTEVSRPDVGIQPEKPGGNNLLPPPRPGAEPPK